MKPLPVMPSAFDERREFLQLFAANSCLHIGNLKAVTEVTVNIFVVISLREFSVLSIKPMAAEFISSRRTSFL